MFRHKSCYSRANFLFKSQGNKGGGAFAVYNWVTHTLLFTWHPVNLFPLRVLIYPTFMYEPVKHPEDQHVPNCL